MAIALSHVNRLWLLLGRPWYLLLWSQLSSLLWSNISAACWNFESVETRKL